MSMGMCSIIKRIEFFSDAIKKTPDENFERGPQHYAIVTGAKKNMAFHQLGVYTKQSMAQMIRRCSFI